MQYKFVDEERKDSVRRESAEYLVVNKLFRFLGKGS